MKGFAAAGRSGGFTIVELVIVIAVVGVLGSIAAPSFNAGRWRAEAGIHEVMAGLGSAQRLAVLRQHDVVVTFLEDDDALRIHRDADNDGVEDPGEDVRLQELPETIGFGLGATPGMAGDPSTTTVTFDDDGAGPQLVFHRNGSASQAGRLYLRPLRGSMADEAAAARALSVERSTGEDRCFSYQTGSWEASC